MKRNDYLSRALAIGELEVALDAIASSDKRDIKSFTLEEVLKEAKYVQSCFEEVGHVLHDDMTDSYADPSERAELRNQYNRIKRFIAYFSQHITDKTIESISSTLSESGINQHNYTREEALRKMARTLDINQCSGILKKHERKIYNLLPHF